MIPLSRSQLQRYRVDAGRRPTGIPRLNRDSPQAQGLVGWWPLQSRDQGSIVGYNNTPTGNDAVPTNIIGADGREIFFDGNDSIYFDATQNFPTGFGISFTHAIWVQAGEDSNNTTARYVCNWGTGSIRKWPQIGKPNVANTWRFGTNGDDFDVSDTWSAGDRRLLVQRIANTKSDGFVFSDTGFISSGTKTLGGSINPGSDIAELGDVFASTYWLGNIYEWRVWNIALPDSIIDSLAHPATRWDLYWQPRVMVPGFVAAAAAQQPFFVEIDATGEQQFPGAAQLTAQSADLDAVGIEHPRGVATFEAQQAELNAVGAQPFIGVGTLTLAVAEIDAVASQSGGAPPAGDATLEISTATIAATGEVRFLGVGDLAITTAQIDAAAVQILTATGSLPIGAASLDAVGVMQPAGDGTLDILTVQLDATAQQVLIGTGAVTIQSAELSAAAIQTLIGVGSFETAALVLDAAGEQLFVAIVILSLETLDLDAAGEQAVSSFSATASLTLQPIVQSASGESEILIWTPETAEDDTIWTPFTKHEP